MIRTPGWRTLPIVALAAIGVLTLPSCGGGREPAGVTFSQELTTTVDITSPIPVGDIFPTGSRPVAAVQDGKRSVVASLKGSTCGMTYQSASGDIESTSIDLASVSENMILESPELGKYSEIELQPEDDGDDVWILRCGSQGLEVCAPTLPPDVELTELTRTNESGCLLLSSKK